MYVQAMDDCISSQTDRDENLNLPKERFIRSA
eukprot:COSAG03_NODE_9515_length_714_cov_0.835772_1_plen_31_part_10